PLASLPRTELTPGEASKSMAGLEALLSDFAEAGLDRRSRVLAFGGGVTSDLAGLAAALFMRGIAYVTAPTTLLAQVDASVGGKTAVNLPAGKNLVGAFHQPEQVLIDTRLLATLSTEEWRSGLGEALKAALLGARLADGRLLFELLESHAADFAARGVATDVATRDIALLSQIVHACVAHKAAIVTADFTERGPREQLNLGHTFAHAIEHVARFGRVPHGVAVATGLALALDLAASEGRLEDPDLPTRTASLARKLGLPASLADLEAELGSPFDATALEAAMRRDKKARDGAPRFVLPIALGRWCATEVEGPPVRR
ncbi:MAG: 3-dehydroquinate synthase, partial [Myxococcales bacterium]|nr:3-dehydroquinate synthase [Myxococcales bacterium]